MTFKGNCQKNLLTNTFMGGNFRMPPHQKKNVLRIEHLESIIKKMPPQVKLSIISFVWGWGGVKKVP